MPVSKTWNSSTYSLPDNAERNWTEVAAFLRALADNAQTTNFQKFAIRVATSSPVTVVSATDCVVVTNLSSAGAVAVNLPAGSNGQVFVIVDGKGDGASNNITITPASGQINGASTYIISQNKGGVIIAYNGTSWTVLSDFTSSGVIGISSGGTGQTTQTAAFDALSPTTTKGDLIVSNGSDNIRLAVGTDGFALVADSGQTSGLAYASVLTNPMTTAGDIIKGGTSGVAERLAIGSADRVLTSNGSTPSWNKLVNANIDNAAAIAGTKIAPDFGSQNIVTTGTLTANDATFQSTAANSPIVTAKTTDSVSGSGQSAAFYATDNTTTRYEAGLTKQGSNAVVGYVMLAKAGSSTSYYEWYDTNGAKRVSTSGSNLGSTTSSAWEFGTGIKLPTSGGTASTLDFYENHEQTSVTFTFNGSGGTSGSASIYFVRIGQIVTAQVGSFTATSGTNSTNFTATAAIPARFRPTETQNQICIIRDNGGALSTIGVIAFESGGNIVVYKSPTGSATFTNSTTCGHDTRTSYNYYIR